jgi:integrase
MPPRDQKPAPGTVRERGGKFIATQPPAGGRKSQTFSTEPAAWDWLKRSHARRVLLGTDIDRAGSQTLSDALDAWLEKLTVKSTTRQSYRNQLQTVFAHEFAKLAVRDIRLVHLDVIMKAARTGHPGYWGGARLRTFFQWAVATELTPRDPWVQSEAERLMKTAKKAANRHQSTGRALTVEQARALVEGIRRPYFRAAVALMLVTGVRRGEALGLSWGAVDGHMATIARNRTAVSGETIVEETPMGGEIRIAYFGSHMLALLDELRPRYVHPEDYVFISRRNLAPVQPDGFSTDLKREIGRLGLPPVGSAHAMRRTMATALDRDGCPVLIREALLGHTGPYAVPHGEDLRKWGERADELFLEGLTII